MRLSTRTTVPSTWGKATKRSRCREAPSLRSAASNMPDHPRGSPSAGPCLVSTAHSRVSWPGSSPATPGPPACWISVARASAAEHCRSTSSCPAPVSWRPISLSACCDSTQAAGLSGAGDRRLTRVYAWADGTRRAADPSWPRSSSQPRSRAGTGSTTRRSDTGPRSWLRSGSCWMSSTCRTYVVA